MNTGLVGNNHYLEYYEHYKDMEFVVLLNSGGWRTAYVNVKNTFLEKLDYFQCDVYVDVHGGFTYKDLRLPFEHCKNEQYDWLGWDYAHYRDGFDLHAVEKLFGKSEYTKLITSSNLLFYNDEHVYTLNEVIRDCKRVIIQIKGKAVK